jgi:SAM-dependent methyltransferase
MIKTLVNQLRQYGRAVLRRTSSEDPYSSAGVVDEFLALEKLLPAEQIIYERLSGWLSGKSVLDVGVGAGRTSEAFGERTGRYLGVDYSHEMIAACERRFSGAGNRFEFRVADARNIQQLGGPWDLIFFSFNGIDHLDATDRTKFFHDVRTMLAPSGMFWFSSHNIRSLPTLYKLRIKEGSSAKEWAYGVFSWLLIRLVNPSRRKLAGQPHAMVNDGALGFGVRGYYGTPQETTQQLKQNGFHTVLIFGMDGRELQPEESFLCTDIWLTYLCS